MRRSEILGSIVTEVSRLSDAKVSPSIMVIEMKGLDRGQKTVFSGDPVEDVLQLRSERRIKALVKTKIIDGESIVGIGVRISFRDSLDGLHSPGIYAISPGKKGDASLYVDFGHGRPLVVRPDSHPPVSIALNLALGNL